MTTSLDSIAQHLDVLGFNTGLGFIDQSLRTTAISDQLNVITDQLNTVIDQQQTDRDWLAERVQFLIDQIATTNLHLTQLLNQLTEQENQVMADLTAITDAVRADTDATNSAISLLQELAAQVAANATDPAAIQALADQINATAGDLASAVTANTPAAPPA